MTEYHLFEVADIIHGQKISSDQRPARCFGLSSL